MSKDITEAITAKNEVIAEQGTSLDAVLTALEGKAAGSGTDISLGLTSASVGQTIKVKAVDDEGKPTEWEAADMAAGEQWELIKHITIAEGEAETNSLTINTDTAGNTFSLKRAKIYGAFPKYTGESTIPNYSFFMLNGITTGANAPYCYTSGWVKAGTTTNYHCSVDVNLQLPGLQSEFVTRKSQQALERFGAARIETVTSIGGTNMLIYPGCEFWLYGVRA